MDHIKNTFEKYGLDGPFAEHVSSHVEDLSREDCRKFDLHKSHAVHARLSPADVTALSSAFPEYKCSFLHNSGEDHGFYHESRNLESKIILNFYLRPYTQGVSIDGNDFAVIDVGGNHSWHAKHSEYKVHCCSPSKLHNADGRDIARRTERDMSIRSYLNGNRTERERSRAAQYLTSEYVCGNLVQQCHVKALAQMSVHSVTEYFEELPSILYQHGSVVHVGSFMAAWDSIVSRRGVLKSHEHGECSSVQWFRKSEGDTERIHFLFNRDKSIGYSHDWRVYQKILTQNIIVHNNHVALFEIIRQTHGIAFFKCTYLGTCDKMQIPLRVTSRVFLPGFEDKLLVRGYLLDEREQLVRHSIVAPREFVEKINSYCTRIVNKEFSITSVLHVAFSVDSTLVVNGSVQLKKSGLSTEDIMFVVTCCYVRMFDVKWKYGMVVKKLLDDIKTARESMPSLMKRTKRAFGAMFGKTKTAEREYSPSETTSVESYNSLTFIQRVLHALMDKSPDHSIEISDHFSVMNMEETLNVCLYGETLEEERKRLSTRLSKDKSLIQTMIDHNMKSIYGETKNIPELAVPETSTPDPDITITAVRNSNDEFNSVELDGMRVVDVPGDGNCGFHALSLGLKSHGIIKSASDIRFCLLAALHCFGGDKDAMRVLLMVRPINGIIPQSGWCSTEVLEFAASVFGVNIHLHNKPANVMMRYRTDSDKDIYIQFDNSHFKYYERVISAGYAVKMDVRHEKTMVVNGKETTTTRMTPQLSLDQAFRRELYTQLGIRVPIKSQIICCSETHDYKMDYEQLREYVREMYLQERLCGHLIDYYRSMVSLAPCSENCMFFGTPKKRSTCDCLLPSVSRPNKIDIDFTKIKKKIFKRKTKVDPVAVPEVSTVEISTQTLPVCTSVVINDGLTNISIVDISDVRLTLLEIENTILKEEVARLQSGRAPPVVKTLSFEDLYSLCAQVIDEPTQKEIAEIVEITPPDVPESVGTPEPLESISEFDTESDDVMSWDNEPFESFGQTVICNVEYTYEKQTLLEEYIGMQSESYSIENMKHVAIITDGAAATENLELYEKLLEDSSIMMKADQVATIPDEIFSRIRNQHTSGHGSANRSAAKLREITEKFNIDCSKMMDLSAAPGGVARDYNPTTKYYYPGGLPLHAKVSANPLDLLDIDAILKEISQHSDYTFIYGDAATDSPTSQGKINKLLLENSSTFAACLRTGGCIVLKSFCLPQYNEIVRTLMESFEYVHFYRPTVSNYCTSEFYIVATGFARPHVAITGCREVVDRYATELASVISEYESVKVAVPETEVLPVNPLTAVRRFPDVRGWVASHVDLLDVNDPEGVITRRTMDTVSSLVTTDVNTALESIPNLGSIILTHVTTEGLETMHNQMYSVYVFNDGEKLYALGEGVRTYPLHDELNMHAICKVPLLAEIATVNYVKSYVPVLPTILEDLVGGYDDQTTKRFGCDRAIAHNFTVTSFALEGHYGYCGDASWDLAFPEVSAIRIPNSAVAGCNVKFDTVILEQFQEPTADLLTAVALARTCVKRNMLYIFDISANEFLPSAIKMFCELFGTVKLSPSYSESLASGRCMLIMSDKGGSCAPDDALAVLTGLIRTSQVLREAYSLFSVHALDVSGYCAGGNQIYHFANVNKLEFDNYYVTVPTVLASLPRGHLHYILADLARIRNGVTVSSFVQNSSDMMKLINVFANTRNKLDTTELTKYTVTRPAVSGNTVLYVPLIKNTDFKFYTRLIERSYQLVEHNNQVGYNLLDGLYVMLRTDGTLIVIDRIRGRYAPYVREHLNIQNNVMIHVDTRYIPAVIDSIPGNVRYYNCPKKEYEHRQHEILGLHPNPMVPAHQSLYNTYYKRMNEIRSIEAATVKRITEMSDVLWKNIIERQMYLTYVPPKSVKNLWVWHNTCSDPYVGIVAGKDVEFSSSYMCARTVDGIQNVNITMERNSFGWMVMVRGSQGNVPAGRVLERGTYLFWDEMSVFTAREKHSSYEKVLADSSQDLTDVNPYLTALVSADIARIEGVAGCGKTTWILNNHDPDTDLVLTQTCAARDDIRERMRRKMPGKPDSWYATRYRTVDSFLMGSNDKTYNAVYIDEGMKAHSGATLAVIALARCNKARVIGDSMQLPYYCREEGFIALFGSHDFMKIERYLSVSYRCPKDTARLLDKHYAKWEGMTSVSKEDNTFTLVQLHSVANIPNDDEALYLTTTQDEKAGVMKVLKQNKCKAWLNVRTTDEAQGNEASRVIYVRYNANQSIGTYADLHQLIVTVTRHKKSFVYAKCVPFACPMAKFIAPVLTGGFVYGQRELLAQQGHYNPGQHQVLVEQNGFTEFSTRNVETLYEPHYYVPNKGVPTVETMPVETIQFTLDQIFPGVYSYPIDMMGQLNAEADQNLVLPKCSIQLDKLVALEKRRGQDAYVPVLPKEVVCEPTLKTILQQDRPKTAIETILAFIKRNADVPDNACDMNEEKLAQYVVNKFFDSYVDPRHYAIVADYFRNKIDLSSNDIQVWADRTNRTILAASEDNVSLMELNLTLSNKYKFQIKPQVKPKCAVASHLEIQALQTITYHEPKITQIFSPLFRKYNDRVTAVLQSNVRIFSDEAPTIIGDKINVHRRFPNEKFKSTEVDFGKFDKSQGSLVLEIELELLRRFGVNEDILKIWRYCHTNKLLLSTDAGMCVPIMYQRNSGDALTFIGNTTIAMCLLASTINLAQTDVYSHNAETLWGSLNTKTVVRGRLDYLLAAGDDSYFLSDQTFSPEGVSFLTDVMNFETKVFSKCFGYFCSRFVIECDDLIYLVSDPMKMFVKLGRTSMKDPGHVEEYRRSLYDLTRNLSYAHVRELVAYAIAERYETEVNTISAICALHSIIQDPERFQELYSFNNDLYGVYARDSCFMAQGLTLRHRWFAMKHKIPIVTDPTGYLFVYSSEVNPEYICLLRDKLYLKQCASHETSYSMRVNSH